MATITFTVDDSLHDAFVKFALMGDNSQAALDRGVTELMRRYVESKKLPKKD